MSARRFFDHVILLTGGTAFAQFVLLLAAPVLTRIYTPSDFGVRSVFVSILTVLVAGVTGRYHMAIMLEKNEEDVVQLVAVCSLVTLASSGVAGLGWWLATGDPELFGSHASMVYFALLPVSLLGGGIYLTLSQWAIRNDRYWELAKAKVAQPAAQLAPQVIVGLAFPGPLGLLLGDAVGRLSSALVLGRCLARQRSL